MTCWINFLGEKFWSRHAKTGMKRDLVCVTCDGYVGCKICRVAKSTHSTNDQELLEPIKNE
jgi:hypothetical protein